MKKQLLLFAWVLLVSSSTAQTVFNFPQPITQKTALCAVNDTTIYIGQATQGVLRFNGMTFSNAGFNLPGARINALAYFNNQLWVGTDSGLFRQIDSVTLQRATFLQAVGAEEIADLAVFGNRLAIGTNNGLYFFDGQSWAFLSTLNSSLTSNRISKLQANAAQLGVVANRAGYVVSANLQVQPLNLNLIDTLLLVMPATDGLTLLVGTQNTYQRTHAGSLHQLTVSYPTVAAMPEGDVIHLLNERQLLSVRGPDSWFRRIFSPFAAGGSTLFHPPTFLAQSAGGRLYVMSNGRLARYDSTVFAQEENNSVNQKTLSINQVEALYGSVGDFFWVRGASSSYYRVPKPVNDSIRNTMSAFAPWISAQHNGQTYVAAQKFRGISSGGRSFVQGPLDANGERIGITAMYDRVWRIDKFEVESFKDAWSRGLVQNGSFFPSLDFREWPGNHPDSGVLAPYHDENNDGLYNWLDGDYPLIKGDQAVWGVFNDRSTDQASVNNPLQLEIRWMAYAFQCVQANGLDSVINYTTFLDMSFTNKSARNYEQTYLALFADGDVGNPVTDYSGMDVAGNGFYFYNATDFDNYGRFGYGFSPPAQGVYLLKGPLANPMDGIDNNRNGLVDEPGEDIAISSYISFDNDASVRGNALSREHFINYIRAQWKDGEALRFGGNGYPGSPGTTLQQTRFQYPYNSDPVGWGFGGTTQQPVQVPYAWSEFFPDTGVVANPPGDRRGVGGIGPFDFQAGSTESITVAFIYSRATNGAWPSVQKLVNQDAPLIKQWYAQGNFPSCLDLSTVSVKPAARELSVKAYPNPARDVLLVELGATGNYQLSLLDLQGRVLHTEQFTDTDRQQLAVAHLAAGIYFLQVQQGDATKVLKVIKQ